MIHMLFGAHVPAPSIATGVNVAYRFTEQLLIWRLEVG